MLPDYPGALATRPPSALRWRRDPARGPRGRAGTPRSRLA